jgi:hypothetical protein
MRIDESEKDTPAMSKIDAASGRRRVYDPEARALNYHHDATAAPRVKKSRVPAKEQFCRNCGNVQSHNGEWRLCGVFPGKAVNANGWCSAWTGRRG